MQVHWGVRGAWLLQSSAATAAQSGCGAQDPLSCRIQSAHAALLFAVLLGAIVSILCAFAFFREDKEEQITPLCPQLVVREPELIFKLPLDAQAEHMAVVGVDGKTRCQVHIDWPDPFRPPSGTGVAATVRILNELDSLLASVVAARNIAVQGQGLALCRAGCEIFGFVEPDLPRRYHVRHRTGVHLLTLTGDFGAWDIEGINPVGSRVCMFKKVGDECIGRVLQYVDAGLVVSALLAVYVHRRLTLSPPLPPPPVSPTPSASGPLSPSAEDKGDSRPTSEQSLRGRELAP